MTRNVHLLLPSAGLILASVVLLVAGITPGRQIVRTYTIRVADFLSNDFPGKFELTSRAPVNIVAGRSADLHLTLEKIEADTGYEPDLPSLGDNTAVDARLDLSRTHPVPDGTVTQSLIAGRKAAFSWKLQPVEPGLVQGTIWLYLRSARDAGAPEQVPLTALSIEINVVSILGLNFWQSSLLAIAGLIAGIYLGWSAIRRISFEKA